ncbi:DNA independent RNA polymerase I transcription factor [Vanrija albida]|uniref:DNA independent RNA polymerase I transcription factor n=1 Tax=Vanrija albida TaxID=181172 RepID=A0ABR3QF68_9TREE
MSRDAFAALSSGVAVPRASSLTGKKRPRDSTDSSDPRTASLRASRRTKSVGEAGRGAADAKDREAFQRQLIGVFVPRALKESADGNMANYNDLLAHFLPTALQTSVPLAPILPLLRALTAHVSLLSPEIHGALISAIVALPWAAGDDRFVKCYVGFAGVLVSAHPGWAKEVVGMAVRGLTWQPKITLASSAPITRRAFHARHHLLISHLLSLIPTLPNIIQPLLNRNSPHKREDEVCQTTWVRNACEMIEYCPELGPRVWSGLVDRMLRIDVEITNRVEDDDEDDDDEDDDDEDMAGGSAPANDPFDLLISEDVPKEGDDEDDDDDDDDGELDIDALSSDDERETDDEATTDAVELAAQRKRKREALTSMRAKLDGMMYYFLRHLEEAMGGRERGPSAAELASLGLSSVASSGASTPRSETPTPGATPTTSTPPSGLPVLPTRPKPTAAQSLAHFQALLNLFSRQILPTSATQHLPFLLFLASSFSPAHTDLFLGLLVSQALYATTSNAPTLASQPVSLTQRVAATVYIGSLVCRARYVTDEQARTVMTYLLAYIDGKLAQARAAASGKVAMDELPLFYAVCQAVMLTFCFRWRALTADTDGDGVVGELDMDGESETGESEGRWMRDLDVLQRALTSELNPLLGCNPSIVSTFAKVAHSTGFAYCFSIIEANQHATSGRSTSTNSANGRSASASRTASAAGNRRTFSRTTSAPAAPLPPVLAAPRNARQINIDAGLDSYFPFDPYDLPRSGEYVEALYRTWSDVAVDLGGDSDDESDSDEDGEESEDSEEMDDEFTRGRMSSSAGRSLPKIMPMAAKPGSYGEHRRRIIKDAGLSTSLEHMSISPGSAAIHMAAPGKA